MSSVRNFQQHDDFLGTELDEDGEFPMINYTCIRFMISWAGVAWKRHQTQDR